MKSRIEFGEINENRRGYQDGDWFLFRGCFEGRGIDGGECGGSGRIGDVEEQAKVTRNTRSGGVRKKPTVRSGGYSASIRDYQLCSTGQGPSTSCIIPTAGGFRRKNTSNLLRLSLAD